MQTEPAPSKAGEYLRWVALPFATLIGAAVASLAFRLIQWVCLKFQGGFSEDGWFFLYILPIFASAVYGYAYVEISYAVAPKAKVVASIVMTTLLGVLCLGGAVFVWYVNAKSPADMVHLAVQAVATMIAAIVALRSHFEDGALAR